MTSPARLVAVANEVVAGCLLVVGTIGVVLGVVLSWWCVGFGVLFTGLALGWTAWSRSEP
ncbi:MAG: hypothetical protein ACRD0L_13705 [Acidimicrobiales bacterium]